ncbi:MAG: DUF5018 domain-containing protein [Marinifilum sp.]|jgi:hypothetical protein|nr:DUF5018 domain-containing protein [Marinifilum sp.]
MKLFKLTCSFLFIFLIYSCDKKTVIPEVLNSERTLKTFSYTQTKNTNLDKNYHATIDESLKTVTVILPSGTDASKLIATFTQSDKASVKIGNTKQISDVTPNDFSKPVTYKIIAEDGSTQDYKITVTIANPVFVETQAEKTQRIKIKKIYDELMAYYDGRSDNIIQGAKNQYDVIPGFSTDNSGKRTYKLGVYKKRFKEYMLKWWAFYKAIAQRPDPSFDETFNKRAESAAFVFSASRSFGHYLKNPPQDMFADDPIFVHAKNGAKGGNLFAANSEYWFHSSVQFNFTEGKRPDNQGENIKLPNLISGMGHRWFGLAKNYSSVGIGYNFFNKYTGACFYSGKQNNNGFQDFSAFPHGYYPIQAELQIKDQRGRDGLFDKNYPGCARSDNTANSGFHTPWTITHITTHNFIKGKQITVTIRDTDNTGNIIDQINGKVGEDVIHKNGSYLRIKYASSHFYFGGWGLVMKPKDGVLSGAMKAVLKKSNKKIFHITISGEGIESKGGKPKKDLAYRIIYYDIDK